MLSAHRLQCSCQPKGNAMYLIPGLFFNSCRKAKSFLFFSGHRVMVLPDLLMFPLQRFCSKPAASLSLHHPTSQPSSSQPQESGPDVDARQGGRGAPGAVEELRAFCRQALYECITQEKPGSLPSYLLLYGLMQGILGADNGSGMYPHSLAHTHGHTMQCWVRCVSPKLCMNSWTYHTVC